MGQEFWLQFKTNKKKVQDYLLSRNFPVDESDKNTIITSEITKTCCWLNWKDTKLEIGSQSHLIQSEWCAAITDRLYELFKADRTGADSTGWWKKGERPGKPFCMQLEKDVKYKLPIEQTQHYEKLQQLYVEEAKRLLPFENKDLHSKQMEE